MPLGLVWESASTTAGSRLRVWLISYFPEGSLRPNGITPINLQMKKQGARPAGLIAKIAGGARMFGASSGRMDIGRQNVEAVKRSLAQEGICLAAQDTGQNYGRTILFYAENGRLEVNTVRHSAVVL